MRSPEAAAVLADVMRMIRADVELGVGGNIEADAVVLNVADGLAERFAGEEPGFDKEAFLAACDLDELIPQERFHP